MALASVSPTSKWVPLSEAKSSRAILYDVPISNNGARVRLIVYKKELTSQDVAIVYPTEIGGLGSEEYLKINPQGKMPAMVCQDTGLNLAESDTIARYVMSKHANAGPSFQPENPKSNLISRLHDIYLTTIQGCLYKAEGPFGIYGTRKEAVKEFSRQLNVIEDQIDEQNDGIYLCGAEVSLADATLFPTCVSVSYIMPKFDVNPPLPPKMTRWFNTVRAQDPAFTKVYDEMMEWLAGWEESGRWDNILGAGWRDEEPETLFDKIISGDIPAAVVKETDHVLAFKDINPAAPAHVLVIPKDRNALTRLSKATNEHADILGKIMVVAAEISRDKELGFGDGARMVINDGPDGGQEVMHLHVHVLGGRAMQWPPG
eukprot:CAMPEP_0172452528 /NCGR_PEP_ID=MMETSP1065-20121228/10159_1 /TAXON_ID=265537 /ORGANISM="Amphiprora paludosa, Strain CCMP125" /LENGTH=372 /DNA_ID=CAMNT_0013204595 /DNA_START=324 /DNA_END=1442 /DNA_ORIENTATION=+